MLRALLYNLSVSIGDPCRRLTKRTFTARTIGDIQKAMGWQKNALLEGDHLHAFHNELDLNQRPMRDAEVIGTACANAADGSNILEIGTSFGHMTSVMAKNASTSKIRTVNIPPEEIDEGGKAVTFAPTRDEIGRYYREQGCENVEQIYANTAKWSPDFGPIDVAFIDGCHDAWFVYNDTAQILKQCKPGSILMWHDFCPPMAPQLDWHREVRLGIHKLFAKKLLRGNVIHLQDSWVGLYRVGERDQWGFGRS